MATVRKESHIFLDSIPDGSEVTALTLPDDDRDLVSVEVRGELTKHWVEPLGYTQYLVGGQHVDPSTIRPKE